MPKQQTLDLERWGQQLLLFVTYLFALCGCLSLIFAGRLTDRIWLILCLGSVALVALRILRRGIVRSYPSGGASGSQAGPSPSPNPRPPGLGEPVPAEPNTSRIANSLLTLLASGGTLEETIAHLPPLKPQIETAFDWMRSNAKRSTAQVSELADRFGKAIRTKDAAINRYDFRVASDARDEELLVLESLGLNEVSGTWRKITEVGVDQQLRDLSLLLTEMHDSKCEPGASQSDTSTSDGLRSER